MLLLPYLDVAEQIRAEFPGADIGVWDGDGPPPPDLAAVTFYAMPYAKGEAPRRAIAAMPALRVVQTLSAGVEKLLPLLPPGVVLCGGRGLHDDSAAEHALALILAAQRDIPRWSADQRDHRWAPRRTRSLAGSRVVPAGYGSIGAALEVRLRACRAHTVRVARRARPAEQVHAAADLPALLPAADILVAVLPDTPATRHLIGAGHLAALPDDALVVNIGRGTTLDTAALTREVSTGRLRAALDVTDPEPLPPGHRLWSAPGVLITPHVAGGSAAFVPAAKDLLAEQARRHLTGRPPLNVIPR
ncbi:2-hydroxyacid dehydrogenase [Spongiactinospora sp. 9N601]|uniref:2-hydroxyacid dehydrogenase n=1 Tax=Spongiactinospora sp. 9N601 TaxID=3375149 RepID=UPI0037B5541B